jgi:hypothetical protein
LSDPHRIVETRQAVLDAIEQGNPNAIVARIDYHIGAALREDATPARKRASPTDGASA